MTSNGVFVNHCAIDRAVTELNAIAIRGGLETVCRVGQYLVDNFGGGDIERFQRRGRRSTSFRKLAEREDLLISASALCRSVGVLAQVQRLPRELAWALTETHHKILLPVRDDQAEFELAQDAVDQAMNTRDFSDAVRAWIAAHRDGPCVGRPPTSPLLKGLRGLERAFGSMPSVTLEDERTLAVLPEDELRQLLTSLRMRLPTLVRDIERLERLTLGVE
jgi:hypothetical protein